MRKRAPVYPTIKLEMFYRISHYLLLRYAECVGNLQQTTPTDRRPWSTFIRFSISFTPPTLPGYLIPPSSHRTLMLSLSFHLSLSQSFSLKLSPSLYLILSLRIEERWLNDVMGVFPVSRSLIHSFIR